MWSTSGLVDKASVRNRKVGHFVAVIDKCIVHITPKESIVSHLTSVQLLSVGRLSAFGQQSGIKRVVNKQNDEETERATGSLAIGHVALRVERFVGHREIRILHTFKD